jgi:TRAP-type mannitol/chloroaromatic compound transport system permease small subunit
LHKNLFLTIDRIVERVGELGLVTSGVLILLMSFLSTYAVGRRYFLNNPEPYSYEISTIFLTACVVLAVSGLQRYKRHLRVDFIANYLPPTVQGILMDIVGPVLALAFVAVITWQSWGNALYSFHIGETSQSIWEEPLYPTKLLVPLGMFWLCVVLVAQIVHGVINLIRHDQSGLHPPDVTPAL